MTEIMTTMLCVPAGFGMQTNTDARKIFIPVQAVWVFIDY